jgi:hypothetical protein
VLFRSLPDSLAGRTYYRPTREGFEAKIQERLAQLRKLQKKPAASNQHDDSDLPSGSDTPRDQSASGPHGKKDQQP